MKILKTAICGVFLSSLLSTVSFGFDLQKLTTKSGKVYHQIEIIDADKHGLLFRHSKGIAKESFPFLSASIRDMFEPVAEVPKGGTHLPTDKGGSDSKAAAATQARNIVKAVTQPETVTLSLRVTQSPVVYQVTRRHNPHYANFHQLHPNRCNWPSHWTRFHSAHYLTNPICRAQATKNFLHATGLLPRPCGVGYNFHSAGSRSHFPVRAIHAPINVTRPAIRLF